MSSAQALGGPHEFLEAQIRWRRLEFAFWLATLLPFVLAPDYLSLASQIAIAALFALSLDLILGYAGIVSLGHAAFFGLGAYTAGLVSKFGWGEPLSGLAIASAVAGMLGYAASFITSIWATAPISSKSLCGRSNDNFPAQRQRNWKRQ